jgi:hypothetical protein
MRIQKISWGLLSLTIGALGVIGIGFLGAALMVAFSGDVPTAIMLTVAGVLIGLPPQYDPAVRLKEWLERS